LLPFGCTPSLVLNVSQNQLLKHIFLQPEDQKLTQSGTSLDITLTHSCPNAFADSAGIFESPKPVHHGLSYLGRALVKEMNRLGVLVDLSRSLRFFPLCTVVSRFFRLTSMIRCRRLGRDCRASASTHQGSRHLVALVFSTLR
jgi:hypothetical protein